MSTDDHGPRRRKRLLLALLLLLAVSGACSRSEGKSERSDVPQGGESTERTFSAEATKRCLTAERATIAEVQPRDARFQALGDLAQENSFEATLKGKALGIAFASTMTEAIQLAELLEVPDDPYRVVVQHNVLLMYPPSAEQAFKATVGCLRE